MAFYPAVVNISTDYSPIGKTPAVCFTRHTSVDESGQGKPMRVLLLGCSDLRHLLYTTLVDSTGGREWDVTLCDQEPAVIARNILLLALIIDGVPVDSLWDIYYHFRLRNDVLGLLNVKCSSLAALATSPMSWAEGPYGKVIKLSSSSTMAILRRVWLSWETKSSKPDSEDQQKLDDVFRKARRETNRLKDEPDVLLTGFLSLLPGPIESDTEAFSERHRRYWRTGTTSEKPADDEKCPNPTFVAADGTTLMHRTNNPLFGFHLSAYLSSTTYKDAETKSDSKEKFVRAAKKEFGQWIQAFAERVKQICTTLRFEVASAPAFCLALRARNAKTNGPAVYRGPWTFSPLELGVDFPDAFEVIETSDLMHYLGGSNLLAAVAPLLAYSPAAVLYTELLTPLQENPGEALTRSLCNNVGTVAVLLGLFPSGYWTNTGDASQPELSRLSKTLRMKENEFCQTPLSQLWRRTPTVATFEGRSLRVEMECEHVTEVLCRIYQSMFMCNMDLSPMYGGMVIVLESCPRRWIRSSLVAFILAVRDVVDTDWAAVCRRLMVHLRTFQPMPTSMGYIEELGIYMHLTGLYTSQILARQPGTLTGRFQRHDLEPGRAKPGLGAMPSVVCVTIRVPRPRLSVFETMAASAVGRPSLQVVVGTVKARAGTDDARDASEAAAWLNVFAALQVTFGKPIQNQPLGKIVVAEDRRGWSGQAPLVVSFLVPTWVLLRPPPEVTFEFRITPTAETLTTGFHSHLGPQLVMYSTTMANSGGVLISPSWPNRLQPSDYYVPPPSPPLLSSLSPSDPIFMASSSRGQIYTLLSRIHVGSDEEKRALLSGSRVQVLLFQPQACTVTIADIKTMALLNLPSPLSRPLNREAIVPRAVRQSRFVEVEVRVATALAWTRHPHYLFPAVAHGGRMHDFHLMPRIDLDSAPELDLSDPSRLGWLVPHMASMITPREAASQRTAGEDTADESPMGFVLRRELKQSLTAIFSRYVGLRAERRPLGFAFNLEDDGSLGNGAPKFLLLPRGLRYDHGTRSVVLDAVYLPVRKDTVKIAAAIVVIMDRAKELVHMPTTLEEIVLWKMLMPACAGRCRSWRHREDCGYIQDATLSVLKTLDRVLCSCGEGEFPDEWEPDMVTKPWTASTKTCEDLRQFAIDTWTDSARMLATRVAIPLVFSSPAVDERVKEEPKAETKAETKAACHVCSKERGPGIDGALKPCQRCESIFYCSRECLKADWKRHKPDCKKARKRET